MSKKLLSLLVFFLLTSCLFPATAMAASAECEMDGTQYDTLEQALAMVGSGENKTIKILNHINYNGGIVIDGDRTIIFDLNGFTVNINNTAAEGKGLSVASNSTVDIAGAGSLNVSGTATGVYARGGNATVTNATSQLYPCFAIFSGSSITVKENAVATGTNSQGAISADRATVVIDGDVLSTGSGVSAAKSAHLTVNGNIVAENGLGAVSDENSTIIIRGNVNASRVGVKAIYGDTITVDGVITAPIVISVYGSERTLDDYDSIGTGSVNGSPVLSSTVWIQIRNTLSMFDWQKQQHRKRLYPAEF